MISQKPASPAIAALQNLLSQQIPFLNGYYPFNVRDGSAHGKGARLQFGAGPKKQTSHLAGLALDIFLASQARTQRILAHQLIAAFVAHSAQMQWSQIIYENSNFIRHGSSVRHEVYRYDREHFNHIHIDWWQATAVRGAEVIVPARAANGSFAFLMRAELAELNQNWMSGILAPLNLETDVRGINAFHNVGR